LTGRIKTPASNHDHMDELFDGTEDATTASTAPPEPDSDPTQPPDPADVMFGILLSLGILFGIFVSLEAVAIYAAGVVVGIMTSVMATV
jgi:hypothetical protein